MWMVKNAHLWTWVPQEEQTLLWEMPTVNSQPLTPSCSSQSQGSTRALLASQWKMAVTMSITRVPKPGHRVSEHLPDLVAQGHPHAQAPHGYSVLMLCLS